MQSLFFCFIESRRGHHDSAIVETGDNVRGDMLLVYIDQTAMLATILSVLSVLGIKWKNIAWFRGAGVDREARSSSGSLLALAGVDQLP